jgi:molecular chaperone HscA
LLAVSALEQTSGVHAQVEVKPSYGLPPEAVARMLTDAIGNAEADAAARMLREAEVEARRLLDACHAALHEDGDALLQPREQLHILTALQNVADLLEQCALDEGATLQDHQQLSRSLRDATEALNRATTPFAGRRMDTRVRSALAGQTVDQLAA